MSIALGFHNPQISNQSIIGCQLSQQQSSSHLHNPKRKQTYQTQYILQVYA